MARTALTERALSLNAGVTDGSLDSVNPGAGNGHSVDFGKSRRLIIRINATFAGAKDYTFLKGHASLPKYGQGDLVVSCNQDVYYVVVESARFMQTDGKLYIDVATGATGTIEALRLPAVA